MERGTLLAGVLAGFALSTVTFVVLDDDELSTAVPDTGTHDMLGRIVELLEEQRREVRAPVVAQPTDEPGDGDAPELDPERRHVLADQSVNVTLAQLLAEVRSIRDVLDQQRPIAEVMPTTMNVGAVRAAIELGERDGGQLHSQLLMTSRREVLRRFGRPSVISPEGGIWTYEPNEQERLRIYFSGDLVRNVSTDVDRDDK